MGVAIGVDSHKSSMAAAEVDELGRVTDVREFSNDPRGHGEFAAWLATKNPDHKLGIEGSRHFAARLTRDLLAAGENVYEVPAFVTHRARRAAPSRGKSDLADAVAIARSVARGDHLYPAQRDDVLEDLKLLSDRRDDLVRRRVAVANRLHKELTVCRPGYEATIPKLTASKHLRAVLVLVRGDHSVRGELIRDYVDELRRLDSRIAAVTGDLAAAVARSNTSLTTIKGVGFVLAAKILGEVGDVRRIRSKASFAMLNGTAPLPASSGRTHRHRFNRRGNRQLNFALHMMALARCRYDADTRLYIERKRQEGKTSKEALRCLKRQLSNVVYRQLRCDLGRAELGG